MKKYIIIVLAITLIFTGTNTTKATFKIILNFDDGYQGIINNAFPLMKKNNIPAVVFMPINYIGTEKHLSLDNLKTLKNSNWEIGSHTINHPDLFKLTAEGLENEIANSQKYIKEKKLNSLNYISFCSPMTAWNKDISNTVSRYYNLARGDKLYLKNKTKIDRFEEIPAQIMVIIKNTNIEHIERKLKLAKKNDTPLILVFHEIKEGGNIYYYPPQKFKTIIEFLKESKEDIITYKELYDLINNCSLQDKL